MTGFIKNSIILSYVKKFTDFVSEMWNESHFGWLVTRNMGDVKSKNSLFYRIINYLISGTFSINIAGRIGEKIRESWLLNILSHYELGVYLLVFLAPIVPTMICVALVIMTFMSFFINSIVKNKFKIELDAFGFFVILFALILFIYSATSYSAKSSLGVCLIYLVFLCFMFLVVACGTDKKRLKIIIFSFVTSGLIVSLYGIYQHFFGNNIGHAWVDEEMFSNITVRVYSTLENPNVLGEYLLLLIPICGAMVYNSKRLIIKFYYLSVLGSAAVCMLFTQSRGCWLGLILAAIIFAFFVDKKLVALGIIVIMFAPMVLPESIIQRFSSIGNLGDSSTSYRVNIWLGTLRMVKDYWWMGIGIGSDAFNSVYPFYNYNAAVALHSHNLYLQILVETGVCGMITFITSIVVSFKKILVGYIYGRKNVYSLICAACISGLTGFLLQGMFDHAWYNLRVFGIFWIIIGIGVASRRCVCEEDNTCNK